MLINLAIAASMLFAVLGSPLLNHEENGEPPSWLLKSVERWRTVVNRVDKPHMTPELVLAVIAHESKGINGLTSTDGWHSVGLMQIIPRPHTGTPERLMIPEINIDVGTRMLSDAIDQAIELGYDDPVRYGLAAYNCGWKTDPLTGRIAFKLCNHHGGMAYADKVLEYWMPYFADGGIFANCKWVEGDRGYWNQVCPEPEPEPAPDPEPLIWRNIPL